MGFGLEVNLDWSGLFSYNYTVCGSSSEDLEAWNFEFISRCYDVFPVEP